MKRKTQLSLRKRKRIVILFVLTIVIPSIVLGVFALRSLENESLLMQKSFEEEQAALLNSITIGLESSLEEAERSFEKFLQSSKLPLQSEWKKFMAELSLIKLPFLLKQNGEVTFPAAKPLFVLVPSTSPVPQSIQVRDTLFQQAEHHELQEKDYLRAAEKYRILLEKTRSRPLQAELLIRIARCYKNIPDLQNALSTYQTLSKNFSLEQTNSGIPYRVAAMLEESDLLHALGKDSIAAYTLLTLFQELLEPIWLMEKEQLLHFIAEIESRISNLREKNRPAHTKEFEQLWQDTKDLAKKKVRETERLLLLAKDVIPFVEQARGESGTSGFYRASRTTGGEIFLVTSLRLKKLGEAGQFSAAGFEIDENVLRYKILPELLSPLRQRGDIVCAVQDQQGNLLLGEASLSTKEPAMRRQFEGNVPPWTVNLYQQNPELLEVLFEGKRSVYLWAIILVVGALVFGTVITIRLFAREWELEKLQADFVSSVSHEFRSPLTAISQVIDMLERGRLLSKDRRQRYYEAIKEETQRLARMVENTLNVSKMEEGRKEYEFETLDIRAIIREAVEHFQHQKARNNIRLFASIPKTLPTVRADRTSLLEALLNLLDNAVKYSGDSKRIDLSVAVNGQQVAISVRDYGIGISEKELNNIFEKFYRTEEAKNRRIQGTGLGLVLVRETMNAHHGVVVVESEPGKGSTFTLTLPLHTKRPTTG